MRLGYQKVEYNGEKTDHQRPKVVPERVVLVFLLVSLGKTIWMTGCDSVGLEEVKMLSGHHDNGWQPNRLTMVQTLKSKANRIIKPRIG